MPTREKEVVESMGKNILFLSRIIKKKEQEEDEKVEGPNNVSKDIVWNTSLMISDGFVKIKGILRINSWPILSKSMWNKRAQGH
jgi:hypothetical protein